MQDSTPDYLATGQKKIVRKKLEMVLISSFHAPFASNLFAAFVRKRVDDVSKNVST